MDHLLVQDPQVSPEDPHSLVILLAHLLQGATPPDNHRGATPRVNLLLQGATPLGHQLLPEATPLDHQLLPEGTPLVSLPRVATHRISHLLAAMVNLSLHRGDTHQGNQLPGVTQLVKLHQGATPPVSLPQGATRVKGPLGAIHHPPVILPPSLQVRPILRASLEEEGLILLASLVEEGLILPASLEEGLILPASLEELIHLASLEEGLIHLASQEEEGLIHLVSLVEEGLILQLKEAIRLQGPQLRDIRQQIRSPEAVHHRLN